MTVDRMLRLRLELPAVSTLTGRCL